jgi:sugar phosphate permease
MEGMEDSQFSIVSQLTLNPQWLFIIFGIITLVWAVVLLIFLPDTPDKARFLDEPQQTQAVDRIRSNQTGMKDNHFKWDQVREVVQDPNVLLLMVYQLTFSIPNGAHTTVSGAVEDMKHISLTSL